MRASAVRRVVFSQAYPFLFAFAARNFLATHPLASSPLWLEENDFTGVSKAAHLRGVPNPLRIDRYTHHPLLSPYAVASAGAGTQPSAGNKAKMQYNVPICRATITHFLYLYNFDQMAPADSYTASSLTGTGGDSNVLLPREAADGATPPHSASQEARLPAHTSREETLRDLILAESDGGQSMLSITSGKSWPLVVQNALRGRCTECGYTSRWWGTLRQWKRVGLVPQFGCKPHQVAMPCCTKLVHISLMHDAEAVLHRSYISSKTGLFTYYFDDTRDDSSATDRMNSATLGDESGAPARLPATSSTHDDMLAVSCKTRRHGEFALFARAIMDDMARNKYSIPLYFSSSHIQEAKLRLRPDAVGVSITSTQLPRPTTTFLCRAAGEGSSAVDAFAADFDGSVEGRAGRQLPAIAPQYYYHLSQLSFPAGFTLPAEVIEAERRAPHEPRSGRTGEPLPHVELTADCLAHVYPELAAVLTAEAKHDKRFADPPHDATSDEADSRSITAAEGQGCTAGASHMAGRSCLSGVGRALWFLPEDVIAFGGVVDVNAAPVEVTVTTSTSDADDNAQLAPGIVFNVACLVDVDAALRMINARTGVEHGSSHSHAWSK